MNFSIKHTFYLLLAFNILLSSVNQIQLVTTHKKSNGTLLRIVTNKVMNIQDIALAPSYLNT